MAAMNPVTGLHPQFSSNDATSKPWAEAQELLEKAQGYWLSTVRPDGRPHVTPLIAIWLDDALDFCTDPSERKATNLEHNVRCVITTGCNELSGGLDVVVEGDARRLSDESVRQRLAGQYGEKYDWPFSVQDGILFGDGGRALVFKISPTTVFGFGKREPFGQTRWRFER